jgi:uncharacterized protein YeaO (DUF488 family)
LTILGSICVHLDEGIGPLPRFELRPSAFIRVPQFFEANPDTHMPIRVVRLGTPRGPAEGARLGTVRRPPRGVRKDEFASRDYFDVWLPELAPSAEVVSWALSEPWTEARWRRYARRYLKEMREPQVRHLIELLAALSSQTNFSIGCYCEDATRCHRSLLQAALADAGASIAGDGSKAGDAKLRQ